MAQQQEIILFTLIGKYDDAQDISVFFDKFNSKTDSFNWSNDKMLLNLKLLPDDIASILIEHHDQPYDNLLNLIIQKINHNKHNDFWTILTKLFTNDQDPRAFITQKFMVFNQMNIPTNDRLTWLKHAIPSSVEQSLNNEKLIDILIRYKIEKKDNLDRINKHRLWTQKMRWENPFNSTTLIDHHQIVLIRTADHRINQKSPVIVNIAVI